MFKLIKLELKRNNLKPYFLASVGMFFATILIALMFTIIPLTESVIPLPAGSMPSNWNEFIPIITVFSMSCFVVLCAVMHAKFSVEEYTGKKSALLFSYPQKRSQILLAKCSFIFVYVFVAMIISNILATAIAGFLSNMLGIVSSPFVFAHFGILFKFSFLSALLANVIGLVALRFGFWKKSIITTIVVAVILITPFGNIASMFADSLFPVMIGASVVLLLLSVVLYFELLSRVDKMESL